MMSLLLQIASKLWQHNWIAFETHTFLIFIPLFKLLNTVEAVIKANEIEQYFVIQVDKRLPVQVFTHFFVCYFDFNIIPLHFVVVNNNAVKNGILNENNASTLTTNKCRQIERRKKCSFTN